jgi:hypothetical protein
MTLEAGRDYFDVFKIQIFSTLPSGTNHNFLVFFLSRLQWREKNFMYWIFIPEQNTCRLANAERVYRIRDSVPPE